MHFLLICSRVSSLFTFFTHPLLSTKAEILLKVQVVTKIKCTPTWLIYHFLGHFSKAFSFTSSVASGTKKTREHCQVSSIRWAQRHRELWQKEKEKMSWWPDVKSTRPKSPSGRTWITSVHSPPYRSFGSVDALSWRNTPHTRGDRFLWQGTYVLGTSGFINTNVFSTDALSRFEDGVLASL